VASVCQPSTLRMLIWPEASNAQNSMAAVDCGTGAYAAASVFRVSVSNQAGADFNPRRK
jgi:hypothetical protein